MEQRPNRGIGESQVTRIAVPPDEMKEIRATGDLAFWPLLLDQVTPFGACGSEQGNVKLGPNFFSGEPIHPESPKKRGTKLPGATPGGPVFYWACWVYRTVLLGCMLAQGQPSRTCPRHTMAISAR